MNLSAFANLVGARPKWCQNALEVLRLPLKYTPTVARPLGLARLLNEAHGVPLKSAFRLATGALSRNASVEVAQADDQRVSTLTLDVHRYLSLFAARLSAVRLDPPRGRGRPPAPRRSGGVRAAEAYGLDIGALRAGLRISPAERLRALDASQHAIERLRSGSRSR
jgi:hypothetical protein